MSFVLEAFECCSSLEVEAPFPSGIRLTGLQLQQSDFEQHLRESVSGQKRISDGFSLERPAVKADTSPADLFWHLIIANGSAADVLTSIDISELIGIESGK